MGVLIDTQDRLNAAFQTQPQQPESQPEPQPEPQQFADNRTTDALAAQVAELRAELEAERARSLAAQDELQAAKLKIAVAETRIPQGKTDSKAVDMARDKAIRSMSNAKYQQIPPNERLKLLGIAPASEAEVAEAGRVFGKNSNSLEAAQLHRYRPQRYARLKAISQEFGIF